MRAQWQECPRGDVVGQWAAFYVTMNRRGHIVMSRVTYERLGEPKAFKLWFDGANNRVGLKPTSPSMKNAFPVAKYGRHGGRIIRGYRLLQEFNIVLKETIRFVDSEVDQEGVLVLDLRTAEISTRAAGQRGRNSFAARAKTGE